MNIIFFHPYYRSVTAASRLAVSGTVLMWAVLVLLTGYDGREQWNGQIYGLVGGVRVIAIFYLIVSFLNLVALFGKFPPRWTIVTVGFEIFFWVYSSLTLLIGQSSIRPVGAACCVTMLILAIVSLSPVKTHINEPNRT